MTWTAKIAGWETTEAVFPEALREGTQAGLEAIGVKGEEMVRDNVITPYNGLPPAVCFGNLAGSITSAFQPLDDMPREIIGVGPSLGADRYAAPVETGARPHMPPVDALLPWVMKKFGIEDEKQAQSTAFAVAMAIRKRGTQGHEMFSRALEDLEPIAPQMLQAEIALAFARHGFVGGAA